MRVLLQIVLCSSVWLGIAVHASAQESQTLRASAAACADGAWCEWTPPTLDATPPRARPASRHTVHVGPYAAPRTHTSGWHGDVRTAGSWVFGLGLVLAAGVGTAVALATGSFGVLPGLGAALGIATLTSIAGGLMMSVRDEPDGMQLWTSALPGGWMLGAQGRF